LAYSENLRQLQNPERIIGQRAQHIESQRIASGFAQGSQIVAVIMADCRHAKVHRAGSLETARSSRKSNIKKF
jgi:hypothetical protein